MSMEFTLNDLQRQRVEDHLALVEQVLRRSIKTNETVDGMGHDDLYQDGCIALCRAAVSYREEMGAFPAYARTVIRNYLLDRCREIQSARKNLPLLSLDAFAEMGAPEPVSPFHTEDLISDVSSDALLSHFRNRYHGTARLGIEAMELRVRGYSCADIAKLYQKKPNYIGACISRAAEKLRRERIVREFYTACTEQDTDRGGTFQQWRSNWLNRRMGPIFSCGSVWTAAASRKSTLTPQRKAGTMLPAQTAPRRYGCGSLRRFIRCIDLLSIHFKGRMPVFGVLPPTCT